MEENKSSLSLSIFFLALFLSSSLFTFVAIFFDISPVIVPAGVMLVASSILLSRPLALLALLIIARMSLDIFGNTYSIVLGDSFSLSLSQAIGIEVAVLGTVALFLFRRNLPKLPLITPLFSILLWGFLSLLVSIDTSMTAREILRVFDLLILFALAFVAVRTRSDFRKLLILFFASSIIPIAAGIYQFAFDIGFQDESVNIPRIFGTFSHPNIFSLYLFSLIALSFLFFTVFSQNSREKFLSGLSAIFYTGILFITYTRIAWVSLFLFLLILGLLRFRKLLPPLMVIPFILFLAVVPFQERILDSFRPSPDSSITWRLTLWQDAINATLTQGNILFGRGMNTFSTVSENIRGMSQGPSNDPHNDFVKFFIEGGVIGILVFIFFLGKIFLSLAQRFLIANDDAAKRTFLILLALFSSLIIASLSDNIFKNTPVQWIFWITLGATLRVFSNNILSEKEKSATSVLQK